MLNRAKLRCRCSPSIHQRLTVGPQEGRREEALIHQAGEGNDPHHVVRVKGQAAERLTAQLLWGGGEGGTNI